MSQQKVPLLISSPTNLLSIQDVVLDSPAWRANVAHLEDQIDQFEKWIDGFIRALKSYIDLTIKHNTQATALSKKTFFSGLDGTLIDPKLTANVVATFASTLQSIVSYRMKMVSDLEDLLLRPLQTMVKNDIKSFKESRKSFDKMLDKYEAQLYRYSVLSKQKEASALREDAFQLYELRKTYIKSSGDYFTKLVTFKADLENLLVESFSEALGSQVEEIDECAFACNPAKANLPGWKQWLGESKITCEYQSERIKKRCLELQDSYIEQIKPHRSLKRYSTQSNDQMSAVLPSNCESDDETTLTTDSAITIQSKLDQNTQGVMKKAPVTKTSCGDKQGYLTCRIMPAGKSRPPWVRKWIFLQHGWFGACTVSVINKEKGCITLSDRVKITECVFKVSTDIDRRFCFEVVHPKCVYSLQAENEEEMQQWLWAIDYNMEKQQPSTPICESPQALLSPTAVVSKEKMKIAFNASSPQFMAMSTSPLPSPNGSQHENGSITPMFTTTTSSLTALLIREGENTTFTDPIPSHTHEVTQDTNATISQQISSWGMPWLSTLSNHSEDNVSAANSPKMRSPNNSTSTVTMATNLVVWPTKLEMDVPTPTLKRYTSELESSQRELRRLFANVPKEETVLLAFAASYYRKSRTEDVPYGYSGQAFVTQQCVWFYSCTFMTTVNMMIIPLDKIKSVWLENNVLLMMDVGSCANPICFGLWLETPDVVLERLKIMIEKRQQQASLQIMYNAIRDVTMGKIHKHKPPTSHVTTSSALYASVTPVNVQAQQPMQKTCSSSTNETHSDDRSEENSANEEENESAVHQGSPAQGALAAVFNATKQKNGSLHKKASNLEEKQQPTSQPEEEAWPTHIPKPDQEVKCNCSDHLEKVESDIVLPVSAKQLFELAFYNKNSQVWSKLNKAKQYGEPTLTDWTLSETEGVIEERTMSYIMPVTAPMVKAKETDVIETQQVLKKEDHLTYVIMVMTKTPNLPYADAFIPQIKYCITYVSPTSCRLICSMGVKWLKSIFVKSMVNKAATKGMQETVQALVPVIKEELPQPSKNASRKKSVKKQDSKASLPPTPPKEQPPITKQQVDHAGSFSFNLLTRVFVLVSFVFILYFGYTCKKYYQATNNGVSIVWRGVYLRDMQHEITEKQAELTQVNIQVYQLFQNARVNNTMQQWRHPWFSKEHRYIAQDLGFSRERLGAIRYELLSTFRILNRVEYQLMENEYWNWLADQKLQCRKNKIVSKELCQAFEQEHMCD